MFGGGESLTLESGSAERTGALVRVGQVTPLSPDGASWAPGQGLVHSASLSIGLGAHRCSVSVNQVNTGLGHERVVHHGIKQVCPLELSLMMEMFHYLISRTGAASHV